MKDKMSTLKTKTRSKKLSDIIIILTLLGILTFPSCEFITELRTYTKAIKYFQKENFASALELFNSLPKDYKDKELYCDAITAMNACENKLWIEGVRAFESLFNRTQDMLFSKTPFSEERRNKEHYYLENIMNPLQKKFKSLNFVQNQDTFFISNNRGINDVQKLILSYYIDRFYDCLYFYYEEQYQQGKDLTLLAEYPLIEPSKTEGDYVKIEDQYKRRSIYDGWEWEGFISKWYSYRIEKSNSDSEIDPIKITGSGFFIDARNAPHAGVSYRSFCISPFSIAITPEELRYKINVSQSFSYAGFYTGYAGGMCTNDAYKTITTITIKDLVTGKILLSKRFYDDPPFSKEAGGDAYGYFSLTDERLEKDIKPILAKISRFLNCY